MWEHIGVSYINQTRSGRCSKRLDTCWGYGLVTKDLMLHDWMTVMFTKKGVRKSTQCARGLLYGTVLNSVNSFCDVIFSLMRKICYTQYVNNKKTIAARWHSGGVVEHIFWLMDQFQNKNFISRLVECMNSFNIRIHLYYEFIYFLHCRINEFIHFCREKLMNSFNCNTWMHLIVVIA